MGKSLEHKMLQGLVFIRGRVGPVRLVGLVGGPLEEGGFSDWSDGSDWSEIFLRGGLVRDSNKARRLSQKKSRASGGRCGMVLFFSAGLRLRFRA